MNSSALSIINSALFMLETHTPLLTKIRVFFEKTLRKRN